MIPFSCLLSPLPKKPIRAYLLSVDSMLIGSPVAFEEPVGRPLPVTPKPVGLPGGSSESGLPESLAVLSAVASLGTGGTACSLSLLMTPGDGSAGSQPVAARGVGRLEISLSTS